MNPHSVAPSPQAPAIGLFDSGSGGLLTVSWIVRICRESGQAANVVFVGDTANLPYGTKSLEEVAKLSDAHIDKLSAWCPIIGIACNTAGLAWDRLGRRGKGGSGPRVMSIVDVGSERSYSLARVVGDPNMPRRRKVVGVVGTELTADCQPQADSLIELHRTSLSGALGHELPLVPYEQTPRGHAPSLPRSLIHYERTPHIAVIKQRFEGTSMPGGVTRANVRNYDCPSPMPHDLEVVSCAAQRLVKFVEIDCIMAENGLVKEPWAETLRAYLRETSQQLQWRKATSLILACTHFEYFHREFAELFPGMAARAGIVSPSGTLAWSLIDMFSELGQRASVPTPSSEPRVWLHFTGAAPPPETLAALGLASAQVVPGL
jgi:glutamate racemase